MSRHKKTIRLKVVGPMDGGSSALNRCTTINPKDQQMGKKEYVFCSSNPIKKI